MSDIISGAYSRVNDAFKSRLREIFTPQRVSDDEVDILTYAYDATRKEFPPEVVVWAQSAVEVSALMKLACECRVPVYPRGGGTGLTGGALAVQGGVLLSLERMSNMEPVDRKNWQVTAEPGIQLAALKSAVQKEGFFFPPDPSSAKSASLGGCLAECAGGLNCVKYGTTKDWVMKVEAVTPTGDIINLGSKARKSVTGFNLLPLLIGSEGTLAVITKATLRLIPNPTERATFIALFDSVSESANAVQAMLYSGVTPCALEMIDRVSLEAANKHVQDGNMPVVEALLLVETDGRDRETVFDDLRVLMEICRQEGATEIQEAHSDEERLKLWGIRKSLSPAMYAMAPLKTNEDISVPISEYPAMLEKAYQIAKKYDVLTLCFGHVGDGNIHVNFMSHNENDPDVYAAVDELFRAAVAHEGSISGEHGIGITKAPYLHYELGIREQEILREIKNIFDPHHILNPGKLALNEPARRTE